MVKYLALIILSAVLVACGSTTAPAVPNTTGAPTEEVEPVGDGPSVQPPEHDDPASEYPAMQTLQVGETVTLPDGQTITVHGIEFPVEDPKSDGNSDGGGAAEAGVKVWAADLEWCAGPQPEGGVATPDLYSWAVILPDGRREHSSPGEKDPAITRDALAPGECARGWHTFTVPEATPPTALTYHGQDPVTWNLFLVRWEVQDR